MGIDASTATDSGSTALAPRSARVFSTPTNGAEHEADGRQLCTVHPDWCTETGAHDAHIGARHVVMGNDGSELLDARLLDFSGSNPVIGLGQTDTDAAEARSKATELRRFADGLETLADSLDTATSDEQSSNPDTASCPDGVSFCTGHDADHEVPSEHTHLGRLTAMGTHRLYADRHEQGLMAFQLSQSNDQAPGLDFVAGGDWPTLNLQQVDELIGDMSTHLAKLRAARTQLAELVSRGAGETAASHGRTWMYVDMYGIQHAVTCPSWCTTDHTDDMDGTLHPADLQHELYGAEARAEYTDGYEDYDPWPVLCARLAVGPGSTVSPAYQVPHVLVQVAADMYTRPMGPDQLARFIETVAGQLEELRAMHPRLTAARAEWAARTDTTTRAEVAA